MDEFEQCPRQAEWQLCDEEPVDGDTFACVEHVPELIATTTTIIVPYDGVEVCCYCRGQHPGHPTDAQTENERLQSLVADIRAFVDRSLLDGYGCPFCKRGGGQYVDGEY